jgi:hypothetical protein
MEKKPRLFYFDEDTEQWMPINGLLIADILDPDNLANNEEIEVRFRRQDMTDEEYDAIDRE